MTGNRTFPDDESGGFPTPPRSFPDREDREIRIEAIDDAALDAVAEMYVAFDPADRAQGIPPASENRVYDWLDTIFGEGLNVAAFHGDEVAAHATLVPDEAHGDPGEHAYELAIFVLQSYQRAGIGRELLETLLGHGAREDVDRVWLTVERWNKAAVALYKDVGFETCGSESFELEMSLRLDTDG
jgi:GNAT superfamily N-acetyltransferase